MNELRAELEKRPAFPWAHPLLSAAAFEVVQSSVVQCWLMAGEPKTQNELVPAVREYIRFQTGVFSSAIGADRVLPNVATPATGARTTTKKKSSKKRTKKTGKKRRKKTSP